MERENVLNKAMRDYSKQIDILQIILISICALAVPTFLGMAIKGLFGAESIITANSQIIVGSIVNTALIVTAINVKGWKKIVGVITLPSISTILSGYVFKTASVYMAYMIPAIWLGNFAIIYLYKKLLIQKNLNYFLAGIIAIIVKVGVIFGGFSLLNAFGVFPEKLVQNLQIAMSSTQAITATIGMVVAFTVYVANKKSVSSIDKWVK